MIKVLLAEDDAAIAKMYTIKFRDEGWEVVHASNGEEAIAKIKEEKPDIILLDIMMPKKEGTEVIMILKEDPAVSHIPVIFLTNLGGRKEDIKAAQELGAEELIVKAQATPKEVIAKINEILAKKNSS